MKYAMRRALLRAKLRLTLLRSTMESPVRTGPADQRHMFVFLAADYGNLGDLAITHAQLAFLAREFPDFIIEEVPISRTLGAVKRLRHTIKDGDVLTLVGGGNTGDMYDDIQYLRELVVAAFPRNQIISFPQTLEFSESFYGRLAAWHAQRIYNGHRRFVVAARDSVSFRRALAMFPRCRVVLAPDVVLTLDARTGGHREGVAVALREDLERGLDDSARMRIEKAVRNFGNVRRMDTHLGDRRFSREQANAELKSFWERFGSSELVVTDRLHGMIFAVITGTPCLAFDSGTHKVANFYRDWLEDVPGVLLLTSPDEVEAAAREVVASRPGGTWAVTRARFESELRRTLTGERHGG